MLIVLSRKREKMGSRFLPSPAFLRAIFLALIALWILPELVLAKHAGTTRHYKFDVRVAFHYEHSKFYISKSVQLVNFSVVLSTFYRSSYKMWLDYAKQRALWQLTGSSPDLGSSHGKVTGSWLKWLTMSNTISPSIGMILVASLFIDDDVNIHWLFATNEY